MIQDKWFIDTYIAVNILDEIGGPYTIKKKKTVIMRWKLESQKRKYEGKN